MVTTLVRTLGVFLPAPRNRVTPSWHLVPMERHYLAEAVGFARKANQALSPERCSDAEAREMLGRYAELEKLAAFGKTALASRLGDPGRLARASGTSMGKAREALKTAQAAEATPELGAALRSGTVSLDQATEIARAESAAPGSAGRSSRKCAPGRPSMSSVKTPARSASALRTPRAWHSVNARHDSFATGSPRTACSSSRRNSSRTLAPRW
jgi:hypothetical protein